MEQSVVWFTWFSDFCGRTSVTLQASIFLKNSSIHPSDWIRATARKYGFRIQTSIAKAEALVWSLQNSLWKTIKRKPDFTRIQLAKGGGWGEERQSCMCLLNGLEICCVYTLLAKRAMILLGVMIGRMESQLPCVPVCWKNDCATKRLKARPE